MGLEWSESKPGAAHAVGVFSGLFHWILHFGVLHCTSHPMPCHSAGGGGTSWRGLGKIPAIKGSLGTWPGQLPGSVWPRNLLSWSVRSAPELVPGISKEDAGAAAGTRVPAGQPRRQALAPPRAPSVPEQGRRSRRPRHRHPSGGGEPVTQTQGSTWCQESSWFPVKARRAAWLRRGVAGGWGLLGVAFPTFFPTQALSRAGEGRVTICQNPKKRTRPAKI